MKWKESYRRLIKLLHLNLPEGTRKITTGTSLKRLYLHKRPPLYSIEFISLNPFPLGDNLLHL